MNFIRKLRLAFFLANSKLGASMLDGHAGFLLSQVKGYIPKNPKAKENNRVMAKALLSNIASIYYNKGVEDFANDIINLPEVQGAPQEAILKVVQKYK